MKLVKWALIALLSVVVVLVVLVIGVGWNLSIPTSDETNAKIKQSEQFVEERFVNEEPEAGLEITPSRVAELLDEYPRQTPVGSYPVMQIAPDSLKTPPSSGLRVAWLGHGGVLIEIEEKRILVDPVISERASPFGFAGPKRFHPSPISLDDITGIDAVVITHNHYDHLEHATALKLAAQGTSLFVPLGNKPLLLSWGIPADQVMEFDWWQDVEVGDVTLVATPARHYSNRGLFDFQKSLWVSWSIIGKQERVFISGDSGYTKAFSEIGERFGPFDLSIIKVGAYGPGQNWRDIHMPPEESIQTHLDVKGKIMLPVHWGTFDLGNHEWDEPIIRTLAAAQEAAIKLITPRVGELVAPSNHQNAQWWTSLK